MTFYPELFMFFGIWVLSGIIYFLGMSLDDKLTYSSYPKGIKLGVFRKLFYYYKTNHMRMRTMSFLLELCGILSMITSIVFFIVCLFYTKSFLLRVVSVFFLIDIILIGFSGILNKVVHE